MSRTRAREHAATVVSIVSVAVMVLGPWSAVVTAQDLSPTPSREQLSTEEQRARDDWRIGIATIPLPKAGCFEASFPEREWTEVGCVAAPEIPMTPHHDARPLVVGNRNDVSAEAPSGFHITTAIGSFDSVSNVTSESSPIGNSGSPVANAYTLQVNTNMFTTTTCNGALDPAQCRGWEQFVFANNGSSASAFIQYWLIRYNKACPSGQSWNQFSFTGSSDIYCWKNDSGGAVSVPKQAITNLANLSLTGTANATSDNVTMAVGSTAYARSGDNAVNASGGWTAAEFNVFGAGGNSSGGGEAKFNSGASITPRIRIIYGGTAAPTCLAQGFTGETNNLSFGPTAPGGSPPGPAVIFRESIAGGASSNCAAATSVGDAHLATFGGLLYDFQASGDFILVGSGPDFVVQGRLVSGAPTWPDASVHTAIATRMGKDEITICSTRGPLTVDGTNVELADGQSLSTPDGVDVWHVGNVYVVTDATGNSIRAELHPGWINASVGLGRWPARVSGLLADVDGEVGALAARDGTILTNPFSFEEFYQRYGDSWRVTPPESLLSPCGEPKEEGNPDRPFQAGDLDPALQERSRDVCVRAGVTDKALLDACTLDVAVIGDDRAAEVFVGAGVPVQVGTFN
jgi:hypothetical protein